MKLWHRLMAQYLGWRICLVVEDIERNRSLVWLGAQDAELMMLAELRLLKSRRAHHERLMV